MVQSDKIMQIERSNRMLIDEQMIYGKQLNRYPVRKPERTELEKRIEQEIKQQKMERLSKSEYDKLREQCLAKDERVIPLYVTMPVGMRRVRLIKKAQVLYMIMNGMAVTLCVFPPPITPTTIIMLHAATALVTFLNGGIYFYGKRNCADTVLSIDWDIFTEEFVIKRPEVFLGIRETRVALKDFQQIQGDEKCLY